MLCYQGKGIFICGDAGIGKSSLALELIQHGAALIADDIVDFSLENNQLIARCPPLLTNLLHTRELGLIDIRQLFGSEHCHSSATVDLCIELNSDHHHNVTLNLPFTHKLILDYPLPYIRLSPNNPATLKTRIDTLLALINTQAGSLDQLKRWQQQQMVF